MAEKLPPVPHQAPMIDPNKSSMITQVWSDWLQKAFNRMGGHTAQDNSSLEGSKSAAASGSLTLPSGIQIQWGITGSLSSGTNNGVLFPSAFPTGCLQVIAGIRNNSAAATAETGQFGTGNYSTTGFDLNNRTSAAYVFNWIAVGY